MPQPNRLEPLGLTVLFFVASVQPTIVIAKNDPPNTIPCWFEAPAESKLDGQIGISRTLSVGKYSPQQISQLRAIDALCHGLGKAECSDQLIQLALDKQELFGEPLNFAFYELDGYLYSYASFNPISNDLCPLSPCDIGSCNPEWLCNPSLTNHNGVMGVSYLATSAFDQYKAAVGNGLLQAEYMYGVNITASKQLRSASTGISSYRYLSETSTIDNTGSTNVPYYLANQ